jgi:general stress protein 26
MFPPLVKDCFTEWFNYPHEQINCQVTTTFTSHPHVRTMMLYDLPPEGNLVFITSTDTRKWHDLTTNPHVAVCIYHNDHGQILMEGSAKLMTSADQHPMINTYWERLPDYWREFYRNQSPTPSSDLDIPFSFGVILMIPDRWEVLDILKEDYLKSVRKQFSRSNNGWHEEDLQPG